MTQKTPRSSLLAAALRQQMRAAPLRPTRVPRQRAVAQVPNPRRPTVVRRRDGGDLLDLFAVFPDLPRPPRPAPRAFTRQNRGRFGP